MLKNLNSERVNNTQEILFEIKNLEDGMYISITQGETTIDIHHEIFNDIRRAFNMEHYKNDFECYLYCIKKYDIDKLHMNKAIISRMLKDYARLREKYDGNDDYYVYNWRECMEIVFEEYEEELEEYLLEV